MSQQQTPIYLTRVKCTAVLAGCFIRFYRQYANKRRVGKHWSATASKADVKNMINLSTYKYANMIQSKHTRLLTDSNYCLF